MEKKPRSYLKRHAEKLQRSHLKVEKPVTFGLGDASSGRAKPPSPSPRWLSGELAFGSAPAISAGAEPLKKDNQLAEPERSSIGDATKRRAMLVTKSLKLKPKHIHEKNFTLCTSC